MRSVASLASYRYPTASWPQVLRPLNDTHWAQQKSVALPGDGMLGGLCVDERRVYVTDRTNHQVHVLALRDETK